MAHVARAGSSTRESGSSSGCTWAVTARVNATSMKINGSGDWGQFESVTGYVTHKSPSRYDATLALTEFAEEAVEDPAERARRIRTRTDEYLTNVL